MNKVFISYRREDSQAYAGRLADLLTTHLGDSVVFMDVDGISPGENSAERISDQLSACSSFLPVIGPHWLRVRKGLRRRLFLPNDFVRLEILAALNRPIQIIPVLVGGATMPADGSLPKSIRALAERDAVQVTDNRFRTDAAALATVIKTCVGESPENVGDALQLERKRVTDIIETDIRETQRHHRVQFVSLLGSALLVLAIAVAAWVISQVSKAQPHFSQADITPDPTTLRVDHPDDTETYRKLEAGGYTLRPEPFSRSRGDSAEPKLTLADVLGSRGPKTIAAIEQSGKIMFQAVGSTGNNNNMQNVYTVANRMAEDFRRPSSVAQQPSFLFLLGDLILNFGEGKYYYDQFYSPFRNYPAPILAVAGNHDGIIELGSTTRPLDAFLENFCAQKPFHKSPDAGELDRTAQIQPGVYFTFEAPFVRILALYSNVSENVGIISSQDGTVPELSDDQLKFLEAAFTRIKNERFQGAIIIAVHHDLIGAGAHSGSQGMLSDLDKVSSKTGVWPHLVLSANSHSYQRFTRTVDSTSIHYVVVGTGGARLHPVGSAATNSPDIVVQHLDGQHLGYLRLTADRKQLHVDFQPAGGDVSTPTDTFTLDLESRRLTP